MLSRYWPILEIRLQTDELTLRPMSEADLEVVADSLPADVDLDPSATTYDLVDNDKLRGVITLQHYWRCYGTWSPSAWRLNFVVVFDGEIVGVQELEANSYLKFRTVDTSSHLHPDCRGKGWGKQMRLAVLTLAFDHLGAQAAVTSAYHDNHASLAVSRSLGYLPNGESLESRGDGVDVLKHMRMTRDRWQQTSREGQVEVSGLTPSLPLFGLPRPDAADD